MKAHFSIIVKQIRLLSFVNSPLLLNTAPDYSGLHLLLPKSSMPYRSRLQRASRRRRRRHLPEMQMSLMPQKKLLNTKRDRIGAFLLGPRNRNRRRNRKKRLSCVRSISVRLNRLLKLTVPCKYLIRICFALDSKSIVIVC